MGLLSRRRKVPRIVKKVKGRTGRKHISVKQLDPRIRKYWDQSRSVSENFTHIGLKFDINPSLKGTKEGRETVLDCQRKYKEKVAEGQDPEQ